MTGSDACDACLRRTALVATLSGYLDVEWRRRDAAARVLALPDAELLAIAPAAARDRYERFDAAVSRAVAARARVALVCRCSKAYPKRLRALPDPPAVLHVLGDPAALDVPHGVAIVGARRATSYGLDVSRTLGSGLSRAGVPVVSGLALGIDAAAHAGALEGTGRPVAVLAAAPDVPYPQRNRMLHAAVAERGAVISELPPGSNAFRWCFVARNRIVAGMCDATIIIETGVRGGSMITAELANSYNKDVFAYPGRVSDGKSAGCNYLIQNNKAVLLTEAQELIALMNWEETLRLRSGLKKQKELFIELSPDEKLIMEILKQKNSVHIDEINLKSGLSSSSVAAAILNLELQNVVLSLPGKLYQIA